MAATLTPGAINGCTNFTLLYSLIRERNLDLKPHLSTIFQKVSFLVQQHSQRINYDYVEVAELRSVCLLLAQQPKGLLSPQEQVVLQQMTTRVSDKCQESLSPYRETPLQTLFQKLPPLNDKETTPDTKQIMSGIRFQLTKMLKSNPTGPAMVGVIQSSLLLPSALAYVSSFLANKLSSRELCILLEQAVDTRLIAWKCFIIDLICKFHFAELKTPDYFIDLELIYGTSFKDDSYTLHPCITDAVKIFLDDLKRRYKGSLGTIQLDNSVACVSDQHLNEMRTVVMSVFPEFQKK